MQFNVITQDMWYYYHVYMVVISAPYKSTRRQTILYWDIGGESKDVIADNSLPIQLKADDASQIILFTSLCGATISKKQSKRCFASVLILELIEEDSDGVCEDGD